MKKEKNEAYWTLIDLLTGICLHFILFEILGLIFAKNGTYYTAGLLAGCGTAAFLAWHMYQSIDTMLNLKQADASGYFGWSALLRAGVMTAVAIAGILFPVFSFPAVIVGLSGLKTAAFLQPFVRSHLTGRIAEKKRR